MCLLDWNVKRWNQSNENLPCFSIHINKFFRVYDLLIAIVSLNSRSSLAVFNEWDFEGKGGSVFENETFERTYL